MVSHPETFLQSRRSLVQKRSVPSYYREYLDGVVRYVELVLVNDYSMVRLYDCTITWKLITHGLLEHHK